MEREAGSWPGTPAGFGPGDTKRRALARPGAGKTKTERTPAGYRFRRAQRLKLRLWRGGDTTLVFVYWLGLLAQWRLPYARVAVGDAVLLLLHSNRLLCRSSPGSPY